jgi:hypothetical protein
VSGGGLGMPKTYFGRKVDWLKCLLIARFPNCYFFLSVEKTSIEKKKSLFLASNVLWQTPKKSLLGSLANY